MTLFNQSPRLLLHGRVRLTQDERDRLKEAFYEYRRNQQPEGPTPSPNGGTLTVQTQVNIEQKLLNQLGMNNIVVTDLLNTRESISLPVVLQLQNALGVEVVTKDRFMEAAASYCDYIWDKVSG